MFALEVILKNDNETKDNLIKSAKAEFVDKGYMKASLRNICKNAGVTTGALYFFFKDKEDLFAAVVKEPLNKLYYVMDTHYAEERENSNSLETMIHSLSDHTSDLESAKQIIHFMYTYYNEFQLILTKSEGSKFENTVNDFVSITEKHYRLLADKMCEYTNTEKIDDYMIHWISHMHIDTFVHMINHEPSEENALKELEGIMKYLIPGWLV